MSLVRKGKTWVEIFGEEKSKELVEKKRILMQKQIPWNKGKSCPQISNALKGRIMSEDQKQIRRISDKKAYENEELRQRHRTHTIEYLKSGGMKNKNTTIELIFKETLIKNNISFRQQESFKLGIADFYLIENDTFVFCDGDYWHNYPCGKERDSKQVEYLQNKGHRVFRFWEHDIRSNSDELLNKIIKEVR